MIGRTVRVSRPSMRGSPFRIWLRTIFDFELEQDVRSTCVRASGPRFRADADFIEHAAPDLVDALLARLLLRDLVRLAQIGSRRAARRAAISASSFGGGAPVPHRACPLRRPAR